jgi:hypothetical protein
MAFGRTGATGEVRIWRYGVAPAALRQHGSEHLDLLVDQMRRRHNLWNTLVAIDREIRALQQPVIEAGRGEDGRLTPEARRQLQDIEESFRDRINAACRESGCFWTNSQEVKRDWQAARRRGEVRFHRWDGSGVFRIFLTKLPAPADLWDEDGRYVRFRRRGSRDTDAWIDIRVASTGPGGRIPVFASLPVTLHRPLPPDGVVRSAGVVREVIAGKPRWHVDLMIERAPGSWRTSPAPGRGRIAIDLGWRVRLDAQGQPAGVRVAAWLDDTGQSGELVLGDWLFRDSQKIEDLQSIRDTMLNNVRAQLAAWLATNPIPDWLRTETATIAQWRSPGRFVHLWRVWRDNRFDGDGPGFALLDDGRARWRDNLGFVPRDHHLWTWQQNLRDEMLHQRQHAYRTFAAWVARTYAEVVLEDMDLRPMVRVREPEDAGREMPQPVRRMRQLVAPGMLRQDIVAACTREGCRIVLVPAANTTRTCHQCGHVQDVGAELFHRCEACGALWDQDENACHELLRRAA